MTSSWRRCSAGSQLLPALGLALSQTERAQTQSSCHEKSLSASYCCNLHSAAKSTPRIDLRIIPFGIGIREWVKKIHTSYSVLVVQRKISHYQCHETHMGLISTARATSRLKNCCPKICLLAWTSETWGVERFWFSKVFASALFEIQFVWSETLAEKVQSTIENNYSEIISEMPSLTLMYVSNVQLWQYFGNNSRVNSRASTQWHEDTVAASSKSYQLSIVPPYHTASGIQWSNATKSW